MSEPPLSRAGVPVAPATLAASLCPPPAASDRSPFAIAGGTVVALLGLAALVGWSADVAALTGAVWLYRPMAPNTGVLFVALGVALVALGASLPRAGIVALSASALTLVVAIARIAEYATGVEIGVEQWFMAVPGESGGITPYGRMTLFTAAVFVFAAVAVAADACAHRHVLANDLARALGLLVALLGTVFLLGFAYSSPLFADERYVPMALPTAIAFAVLGLSVVVPLARRAAAERGSAAADLRESERRFAAAFEHAAHGIALVGLDGRFLKVNAPLCALTGYSEAELLTKSFQDITHPDDLDIDLEQARRLYAGEIRSYQLEKRYIRRDGDVVWVLLAGSAVRDDAGAVVHFVAQIEDVTPRKEAERAAREREALYRGIARNFPHGAVVVYDHDLRYVLADGRGLAEVGLERTKLEGRTLHELFDAETVALVEPAMRRALAGEESTHEVPFRGRTFVVRTAPVWDAGVVRHGLLVTIDITDRKRLEQEVLDQAAALARSNEELERFAHVASHDLQEPLRMVASFVQLLEQRYRGKLDADADTYIHFAVDGAVRMQHLVRDLLAYSRVGTQEVRMAPVDLGRVLDAVRGDLRALLAETGAVITNDPLPTVVGDATQLRQLLQNLVDNAIKYRRPGVPPCVHVSAAREDHAWRLSVRDNGIGIPREYFDRIFVIFARLHSREEYPGTGVGLALCKRIVERHGGRMWVESEPGAGSTFHATLPDTPALLAAAAPAPALPVPRPPTPATVMATP